MGMTREEAKGNLIYAIRWNDMPKKEALEMAIKALEQEPCEDCISRQAVDTLVDELARAISDERCFISRGRSTATIMQDMLDLPPVTPQPKTGQWIAQDIYNCHTEFKCSECGYIHSFMHLYGEPTADYTYCPICGAKMIEPQESEGE